MRLLLLNQYGPKSGAPTGRILGGLSEGLQKLGHECIQLHSDFTYGKNLEGMVRIVHEARSHLILFWRSLWLRRVDAVISLTSPACLAVTAGIIAKMHRAGHFHWAMDLYPEVAVRLGEMEEGFLSAVLVHFMRRAYEKAERVIALDEDMHEFLQAAYGIDSSVMKPFSPEVTWPRIPARSGPARRWLYSGNFGRAHEIEALLYVQKRLEKQGVEAELVLQGQGAQFSAIRKLAKNLELNRVTWRSPMPEVLLGESLLAADVLVVSRKAEMKGLLVPSKLMLAELSGKPILWIGDIDSQTARRLQSEGRHGVFAPDDVDSIATWLRRIFGEERDNRTQPPATQCDREESIRKWATLLTGDR